MITETLWHWMQGSFASLSMVHAHITHLIGSPKDTWRSTLQRGQYIFPITTQIERVEGDTKQQAWQITTEKKWYLPAREKPLRLLARRQTSCREIPFLFSGNLPRLLLRISLDPFNLGYLPAGHPSTTWRSVTKLSKWNTSAATGGARSLMWVFHVQPPAPTFHSSYTLHQYSHRLTWQYITLELATVAALHYCSHFLTWQYTYSRTAVTDSLTRHCICTAFTASRGSTLTLSRATASTLRSLPHVAVHLLSHCSHWLSHAPLHLHCVHCLTWKYTYSLTCHCIYTAFTASRGSTLTLALQSLTLSRATASALRSLPHVEVHLLSHVPLHLHCVHCLTWQYTYSFTYHCTYSGSALTLARATAAALHQYIHFLPWQYTYSLTRHCIYTAFTASRGSALILARATAATLQSLTGGLSMSVQQIVITQCNKIIIIVILSATKG